MKERERRIGGDKGRGREEIKVGERNEEKEEKQGRELEEGETE